MSKDNFSDLHLNDYSPDELIALIDVAAEILEEKIAVVNHHVIFAAERKLAKAIKDIRSKDLKPESYIYSKMIDKKLHYVLIDNKDRLHVCNHDSNSDDYMYKLIFSIDKSVALCISCYEKGAYIKHTDQLISTMDMIIALDILENKAT
jgi:hypothetical protein